MLDIGLNNGKWVRWTARNKMSLRNIEICVVLRGLSFVTQLPSAKRFSVEYKFENYNLLLERIAINCIELSKKFGQNVP